jgi:hypothetical protein
MDSLSIEEQRNHILYCVPMPSSALPVLTTGPGIAFQSFVVLLVPFTILPFPYSKGKRPKPERDLEQNRLLHSTTQ